MTAVRRAVPEDAGQVADLVATAFLPLKAIAYLLPDPAGRQPILAAFFRILVDHALEHGHVDVVDDGPAAAVWIHRHAEIPDYDVRQAQAVGQANVERFRILDELFDKHHPHEELHHLALLAVHPGAQRRGLGGALLERHHAELGGLPAYLEASSPGSRDLYLRHGYQAREPFELPDGTPFWPMWRPSYGSAV